MKVCVDVDYRDDHAVVAAVLFRDWHDEVPVREQFLRLDGIEPYVPGEFYRRELPPLRAILARIDDPVELIVVDGYVWLTDETRPGLGGHLHAALGGTIPVIGVAKTLYRSATRAVAVVRGEQATRPLYVTAAGLPVEEAARQVQAMHGPFRLPTLLKRVDSLCRQAGLSPPVGGSGRSCPALPDEPA